MTMQELLEEIKVDTNSEYIALWLRVYEKNSFILKPFYVDKLSSFQIQSEYFKINTMDKNINNTPLFTTLKSGNSIIVNNKSYEFINKIDGRMKFKVRNSLTIPIKFANLTIGVIQLYNKDGDYTFKDIEYIDKNLLSKVVIDNFSNINITGSLELSIVNFTEHSDDELKDIWYNMNMLTRIVDFEDSNNGRYEYYNKIFEKHNKKIDNYISRLERSLNTLNYLGEKAIGALLEYLMDNYGDINESEQDNFDDEVSLAMIISEYKNMKKYVKIKNISENESNYILDIIKNVNNINDFYEQSRNSLENLKLSYIKDMLLSDNSSIEEEDEFLGMSVVDDVTNESIQEKINLAQKALIKFHRNIKSISYFAKPTNIRFFSRELEYFVKYIEELSKDKYEKFNYLQTIYNIDIEVNLENNCKFKTDAFRLEEVIDVLIENAAEELAEKEAREGEFDKKIVVNLTCDEEFVKIQIVDNGRGIPEFIRDKIFDKYFSANKRVGSGVGLSFAKDIVEQGLKGELNFETEVGVGTMFEIKLKK